MSSVSIEQLNAMRHYFTSGVTRSYTFRKQQLLALKKAIIAHEQEIYTALYRDLKKSPEECWVTENGFVLSELDHTISWLSAWMEPERKSTNLLNLPSKSSVVKEPLGIVLIMGPWNYPFQLLLTPLIGAIAAGNCVVLKPSEFAPTTDAVKELLITAMKKKIVQFFSDQPKSSHEFGKIINEKQFHRLIGYLKDGTVVHGGEHDVQHLFIAPTLIESVSLDSSIMSDEIFGPILPIISYDTEEEALSIIQKNPNPLAFYVFSNHGKYSFDTFSHEKAVLQTPTWFDPSMKYPPFKGKLKLFKKFI